MTVTEVEVVTPISREQALVIAASDVPMVVADVYTAEQLQYVAADCKRRGNDVFGGRAYTDADWAARWVMSPTGRLVPNYSSPRYYTGETIGFHHDYPRDHAGRSTLLGRVPIHSVICVEGTGELQFARSDRPDLPTRTRGVPGHRIITVELRPGVGVFWGETADQRWMHGTTTPQHRRGLVLRWSEPKELPS